MATSAASATSRSLLSWLHLALIYLPLVVKAQSYSNNPSTDWALSSFYNASDFNSNIRYRSYTVCNNRTSFFELLNQEKGLYGKWIGGHSVHTWLPYTLNFLLYFVTSLDNICVEGKLKNNGNHSEYYLSLVALNGRIPDPNKGQVIWTANPDRPVTMNACLHQNESDVILVDYHDQIVPSEVVWHVRTGVTDLSLATSFVGNLVLFSSTTDPPYKPLWESFRDRSDTLMVLQALDNSRNLTVKSTATSNSGNYTLAIRNGRVVLYADIGQLVDDDAEISSYGSPYWVWPSSTNDSAAPAHDNISFVAFCWDSVNQLRLYAGSNRSENDSTQYGGMVSPEFCSTVPNNSHTTMQITGLEPSMNATYATFLRLEADGDLRAYTVDNTTYPGSNSTWRSFYSVFNHTPCDLPLYCGVYGMCDPQRADGSHCNCDYGDGPKLASSDASDPKSGCTLVDSRRGQLWDVHNISSGSRQGSSSCPTTDSIAACTVKHSRCNVAFLSLNNVHYFSLNFTKGHQRLNDSVHCKQECQNNCACAAAFWDETSKRCFLVLGRLGTIQKQGTMQAFIKYIEIKQTQSLPWKIVGPALAATLLVACISLAYWLRRRALRKRELEKERWLMLSLLDCSNTERFTWKQMHEYTCGFSDLLGGGGFGRVFRGALPDGTAIAVKQLDEGGSLGQGNKEFIAEVNILSRIHHANLVHLIGFCLDGNHKLLVYEYMENGLLDSWLFKTQEAYDGLRQGNMNENDKGRKRLPWKARFQIALDTAKGLAYLHEECEERVMHLDLKPQNILLGRNFQAKISDFGMSRRTGREQTSVMTVMKGTPGYLAPEWLLDCAITEKCDVYSFGIVLLEMVSGKKVKDLKVVKQKLRMRPLRESIMMDVLDESLRYDRYGSTDVNVKEAVRMVEVGLMCVRRNPTKRPAMSSVSLMLEGKEEVAVQEMADEDDEDDEGAGEERELVMYPSDMHRHMRTEQRHPHDGNTNSLWSFTDYSDSNIWWNSDDDYNYNYTNSSQKKTMHNNSYNKYLNMDHNPSKDKAYSFFQRDTTSSSAAAAAGEWDHLLQREQP